MKSVFKILLILTVTAALIVAFIGIGDRTEDLECTGMELIVEDSLSLGLIDKQEVQAIIDGKKMQFKGKKISEINMGNIERTLCESPYIDTVICSLSASGILHLSVVPKIPTLHVMENNGDEYYLDRRGCGMPIGNLAGNLTIATGKISKKFASTKLAPLACYIQDNEFWHAQIQQIHVVNEHDVRLYTRIADHVILFGEPTDIENKLWKLRVFYEKGLPQTGWNKYETISLEYENIIIGKRKDYIEENTNNTAI